MLGGANLSKIGNNVILEKITNMFPRVMKLKLELVVPIAKQNSTPIKYVLMPLRTMKQSIDTPQKIWLDDSKSFIDKRLFEITYTGLHYVLEVII